MAAIIAAVSEGTWAFLGVFVTNVVLLVGLFVRQGRIGRSVDEVNRAVNHQPADHPTLIARVIDLEEAHGRIVQHRSWEREALGALATEIGCELPPYPTELTTPTGEPL